MPTGSALTRDDIAAARAELLAAGRQPSQRAIIRTLGRGSFSQVGPWLRELEAQSAQDAGVRLAEPLEVAVREATVGAWAALEKQADRLVADARGAHERDRLSLEQERDAAIGRAGKLEARLDAGISEAAALEQALDETRSALAASQSTLIAETVAHATTRARVDGLQTLAESRREALDRADRNAARTARAHAAELAALHAALGALRADRVAERAATDERLDAQTAAHVAILEAAEQRAASLTMALDEARTGRAAAETLATSAGEERDHLRERLGTTEDRLDGVRDELARTRGELGLRQAALDAVESRSDVAAQVAEREHDARERTIETRLADLQARLADKDALIDSLRRELESRSSAAAMSDDGAPRR